MLQELIKVEGMFWRQHQRVQYARIREQSLRPLVQHEGQRHGQHQAENQPTDFVSPACRYIPLQVSMTEASAVLGVHFSAPLWPCQSDVAWLSESADGVPSGASSDPQQPTTFRVNERGW